MAQARIVYIPVQQANASPRQKTEAWDAIQLRVPPGIIRPKLRKYIISSGYEWDEQLDRWYMVDDPVDDNPEAEEGIPEDPSTEEEPLDAESITEMNEEEEITLPRKSHPLVVDSD